MKLLVIYAVAILAMTAQDILGTLLVVAEAKGRARLAGAMDALGDIARVICAVVGVDSINKGINIRSVSVLAVMCLTSYNATRRTTAWSRRLREESPEGG